MLHICVAHVSPHVHIRVFHVCTYVCHKPTQKFVLVKHVCAIQVCTSVAREHKCLLQASACMGSRRTQMCVAGEQKCSFETDERACVCVRVPGTHMCVSRVHICVHMRVARVHRRVFTCTHFCVPNTHVFLCSRRTRVCYEMNTRVCLCFPLAHKNVCVHVCSTHVCAHVCALVSPTRTHMCVHVCTHVRSNWTRVCVFTCTQTCVPRVHIRVCVPGEHMVVMR